MAPPLNIRSEIPQWDANNYEPILVILLGKIFSDKAVLDEAVRVTEAMSRQVLIGSNHFWPAYVAAVDVEEDIYGNSGTSSDIYDLAAKAKAKGWRTVVYFDEWSWRQHKGTVTNHEDPTLSVTVVNVECVPTEAVLSPDTTFFIRRLPIVTGLAEALLAEPQRPRDWSQVGHHARNHAFTLHLHAGFYLYNPDEPMFGDGSFAAAPSSRSQVTPLKELIDTSTRHEQGCRDVSALIQPLVRLEEEQREFVRAHIQTTLTTDTFSMSFWDRPTPATRRDVARILRRFCEDPGTIVFVLSKPETGKPLDTAVYGRPFYEGESFPYAILVRQTPEELGSWWRRDPLTGFEHKSQLDRSLEFHIDPLLSFPLSLPAWYKTLPRVEISRELHAGYSDHQGTRQEAYLAFYLTASLTEDERERARTVTEMDDMADRGFTYVAWESDIDGNVDDMLRIMKAVRYAARTSFTVDNETILVFIDRQFKEDGKVIIASWCLEDDGYSGIQFGRADSEIANCLVNVPGNMDMEDFVPDLQFFRDPDYNGPERHDSEAEDEE